VAAESFYVVLRTPGGTLLDEPGASAVEARAVDGDIEVRPGHEPLLAPLDTAPLTVRATGGERTYAVHGGFIEVKGERVRILAGAAEEGGSIDLERAEMAKKRAEERLKKARGGGEALDMDRAEMALKRALLRLRILKEKAI